MTADVTTLPIAACIRKASLYLALFAVTIGSASLSDAATITSAGSDLTTSEAWRTTTLAKPLDLDGNNVYGTSGYYFIQSPTTPSSTARYSVPAFAAIAKVGAASIFTDGHTTVPQYTLLDDSQLSGPAAVANVRSGVVYKGGTTLGNEDDLVTITLTESKAFRLGVITDNADLTNISPTSLRVRQTVGGSANSGLVAATTGRDLSDDYYFFDISGNAGDTFVVSGVAAANGSNGIGGVFIDKTMPGPTIAQLRSNYDAHTPINGEDSAGKIADTFGTGRWTFLSSSDEARTSTSLMTDSTTANSVRAANAYITSGQTLELPAVKNDQVITGSGEGVPAFDELALHPGFHVSTARPYVVTRWTAGAGEAGAINVMGSLRDIGAIGNGLTFDIFVDGVQYFNPAAVNTNAGINFDFDVTVTVGSVIDFVVGNNGDYGGDHAALAVTISQISLVPEPAASLFMLVAVTALLKVGRRRMFCQVDG